MPTLRLSAYSCRMAGEWQILADQIRADMEREGIRSQRDLAHAAEVSERTVSDLLSGRSRKWLPRTMPAIERVLGWRPGTARRIVAGEEPFPVKGDSGTDRDELWRLVRGMTEDELETFLTEYLEYLASRRRNPV